MFSILIPAYNVEAYIQRCLDSILNQTFPDFEVIIIDDGSTDNTLALCNSYVEKDSRIQVYHQENAGVAVTRNLALSKATGEWIAFVDADDYIAKNYLEAFVERIKKNSIADVFVCGYYVITENGIKRFMQKYPSKQTYLLKILRGRNVATTLWAKIIRRDFIEKHNARFLSHINMGEDLCFMARLFYEAKDIDSLSECLYYWEHTNVNSMTSNSSKYIDNMLASCLVIFDFYKKQKDFSKYKVALNARMLDLKENIYINTHNIVDVPFLDILDMPLLMILRNFFINHNYYWLIRCYRKYVNYVSKFNTSFKKI